VSKRSIVHDQLTLQHMFTQKVVISELSTH